MRLVIYNSYEHMLITMTRPTKIRHVASMPEVTCYRPAGIPFALLEEVNLTMEEIESIRLKDVEGLDQKDGAKRMGVSRPTFQRILCAARCKIARGLTQGQAIRIGGGVFELNIRRMECKTGHYWDVPANSGNKAEFICPLCHRPGISRDTQGL